MSDSRLFKATTSATTLRLAEFVAAFSLATDMGTGVPMESMLRVALMSVHLGEAHGLSEAELVGAYYLPLLALTGCTAESLLSAEMLGDETSPEMARDWMNTDFAKPREAMRVRESEHWQGQTGTESSDFHL